MFNMPVDMDIFRKEYELYLRRKITRGELAERLNMSRPTLDKFLKRTELDI